MDRAYEIGFKFRCWHNLIPRGKWLQWLRQNVWEISERSVQVYLSLWDNKEAIEAHFKSAESADLIEQPSIKNALDFVSSRRTVKVQVTIETQKVRSLGYLGPETIHSAEVPNEAESEEGTSDAIKSPENEVLSDNTELTLGTPQARRARAVSREISPEVAAILNTLMPTPLPEKTVGAPEPSRWFVAIKTAQDAIRELERLQDGYQVHLHHVVDFGPAKKVLAEAERLPVPSETNYEIVNDGEGV